MTPARGGGGSSAPDPEHQKRLDEMEDVSFAKGFACGLGYGGLDMVKSTGETIVGAAKFVGRAHMQVGLRFKWAANWLLGNDNTETNEMIAEVDAAQGKVIDQGLAVGKFIGTLMLDTAAIFPKIEVGLLTGDLDMIKTALHGSETHRKIFEMVSEVLTKTAQELTGENTTAGHKGYVLGKIIFEVASFIIPQTKIGKIMEMTKSQLLGKLIGKTNKVLGNGARNVATATKAAVEASKMCFVAGTLVLTKSGMMKIEDVRVGMWVWSRDEFTQQEGWKRVLRTFVTHPTELYRLTYELRSPPESASRTDTPVRLPCVLSCSRMPATPTLESRLAVRERPSRAHVMHQRWEQLLFLHWRWDAADIQRTLPRGLFVDTFQDDAWVAIVPFFMRGIRPRFCPPVPGISNFLELNVRTYVHDEHGRPGVWFYSLDCNQPLAVWTARTFFHLSYQHARMVATMNGNEIDYTCQRRGEPNTSRFRYHIRPQTHAAEPGSLEFFLAERYLLFSKSPRDIRCGQVHHTPYPLADVKLETWNLEPLLQAGFTDPNRPPDHIVGSPGVDVRVYPLTA